LVDNFWLQIIWKSCIPLSPYPGLKSFAIAVKFGVAKSQSDFDLGGRAGQLTNSIRVRPLLPFSLWLLPPVAAAA